VPLPTMASPPLSFTRTDISRFGPQGLDGTLKTAILTACTTQNGHLAPAAATSWPTKERQADGSGKKKMLDMT
jgi:hypothetical protein